MRLAFASDVSAWLGTSLHDGGDKLRPGVTTHEVPEASFVEENLDSWLDEVGQYCPWSAQLLSVEDYR